jgi:hypothetical protein
MLNIEMVCVGCETKVEAIYHVNGGEIEGIVSFDFGSLSAKAKNDILAIVQSEFNALSARDQLNRIV